MPYTGGKYTIKNYREEMGWRVLPKSYKRACVWNNKMAKLLAKEPKSWKDFSFMPKGEVQ